MNAWIEMWVICISLFVALKILSLSTVSFERVLNRSCRSRLVGYLFAWPGLDADTFLGTNTKRSTERIHRFHWWVAALNIVLGVICFAVVPGLIDRTWPHAVTAIGWSGMIGIALFLHFGVFAALSLLWRSHGVNAHALMRLPVVATSLADFWGNRWNTAFRDVAHRFVFRPVTKRAGASIGTLAVFLFSGVVHDLAISIPARGGYGLPTVYFLLQGAAVLFERRVLARSKSDGFALGRRLFAWVCVVGGVGLLFHSPFLANVMVPMLIDCGVV